MFDTPSYVLPSPMDVWDAMRENWSSLLDNTRVTLIETLAGFGLSAVIGVVLAIAIVYSRFLKRVLYPILVASQAIPKVAIAPLLLIWFGYGYLPKVLVAFLIAFFPVVVTSASGLGSVNANLLRLASSMGMSDFEVFRKIRFPHALPSIMAGFKVAVALAVVGAVVGEFVGSREGLGYVILTAQGNFDTSLVFASVVMLTILGIVLFYIVAAVESWVARWSGMGSEAGDGTGWTA